MVLVIRYSLRVVKIGYYFIPLVWCIGIVCNVYGLTIIYGRSVMFDSSVVRVMIVSFQAGTGSGAAQAAEFARLGQLLQL